MRVVAPQAIKIGLVRQGDGIVVGIFAITKAVEDDQKDRGNFHGELLSCWLFKSNSIKI